MLKVNNLIHELDLVRTGKTDFSQLLGTIYQTKNKYQNVVSLESVKNTKTLNDFLSKLSQG